MRIFRRHLTGSAPRGGATARPLSSSLDRREFMRLSGLALAALTAACGDVDKRGASDALDGDTNAPDTAAPDTSDTSDTGERDDSGDDSADSAADTTPDATGDVVDWDQRADLPSLGGAPDTHDGRTVAAFVDTVIPGAHRDPSGAPGGLDANAVAAFFDERLPALAIVPVLVAFLDATARGVRAGATFAELTPPERDRALDDGLTRLPELGFALQLAKVSYLSSRTAADHLGYPGANGGYAGDPDLSFGVALSEDHPATLPDGNLP